MPLAERPRDPKQIVLEAELLVSSPERIRAWLEESTTQKNFELYGRDEELEQALLARGDPLITLCLAKLASSTAVVQEIIEGPAIQNKPVRLAALMNEVVGKVGLRDMPEALLKGGRGQLDSFMTLLDVEEVMALFGNPTLADNFLIDFFEQKAPWQALDDARRFAALRALQSNSRMQARYNGPYDGYGEYRHNEVFSAAWRLAGKVPTTTEWAAHLCWLYERLATISSVENALQLATRWVPDPSDAKRVEAESENLERGRLGAFARTRKGLARLSVAAAHSADACRELASHKDPSVRAAYYFEGNLSVEEMKQADELVPLLSFEEMMWNPRVWKTKAQRQQLCAMAWDSKRDPNSYMDPQNMFNARRDGYREQHPEWFLDDENSEDLATGEEPAEATPSQEMHLLNAIATRVAEIHKSLVKAPGDAWPRFAVAAAIVGGLLVTLLQAFCVAKLWDWFVAPVVHVAEISVVIAIGFSLLINIFRDPIQQHKGKGWEEIIGATIGQGLGLGFVLVIGWLLHFFV